MTSAQQNLNYYLPPGSLIGNSERNTDVTIDIIKFNETVYDVSTVTNIDSIEINVEQNINIWINVNGIHNAALIEEIGKRFNIHYLTLEDIINIDQRAKFEDYETYNVAFMKLLYYENNKIYTEQLSIVLTDKFIITFQEVQGGDPFNAIRERLRLSKGKVRKNGVDYLAYALIDAVVDSYFIIMDSVEKKIDEFDLQMQEQPTTQLLRSLHHSRRELLLMRKSIAPMRELILLMSKENNDFFQSTTQVYMRDLLDHQIRVIESLDNYREIIAEMIESYISSTSYKMNEIMKVLTIISTFFIPLTFIVGVYGMNFDNMPELHTKYGYFFVWAAMGITVIGLFLYFKNKKWL